MKINKTTYKFILRGVKGNITDGYITLRMITNRKKTYKSLGLPKLKEKFWNPKTERVREVSGVDYRLYNSEIEKIVKNIKPQQHYSQNEDSLMTFFQNYLNSQELASKHGTRRKYQTVFNKIEKFKNSNGWGDLRFSDFDIEVIRSLSSFMRAEGMEVNTTNNYLKVIRAIVRKAQRTEGFHDVRDHFVNYNFDKKEKKVKDYLTEKEISKISSHHITNSRLQNIRNMFLFQLFSKGMRVSDLITLRYNNLTHGRIHYKMLKTGWLIDMPFSLLHIQLLAPFVDFKTKLEDVSISGQINPMITSIVDEIDQKRKEAKQGKHTQSAKRAKAVQPAPIRRYIPNTIPYRPYYLDLYNLQLPYMTSHSVSVYELLLNQWNIQQLNKELKNLIRFQKDKGIIYISKRIEVQAFVKEYELLADSLDAVINLVKTKIKSIHDLFLETTINELTEKGQGKEQNRFVFKFLKDEDFLNVDHKNDFSKLTESQYVNLNKRTIVYNRNLKDLQKLIGITKTLKSHLPRVSYTNLMLNIDGVSVYDISESLGHSSIAITDEYLKTGFKKKKTDDIQRQFEKSISGQA